MLQFILGLGVSFINFSTQSYSLGQMGKMDMFFRVGRKGGKGFDYIFYPRPFFPRIEESDNKSSLRGAFDEDFLKKKVQIHSGIS